jgi:hypothetical protein
MEHDQPFDLNTPTDACEVLVLQHAVKKKNRPAPYVLNDVPALYERVFGALCEIAVSSVKAVEDRMEAQMLEEGGGAGTSVDGGGAALHFYQLYGYDLMLDTQENLVLLEVNKSPVIANGPVLVHLKDMYAAMVLGMLELLGLPVACASATPEVSKQPQWVKVQ